MSLLCGSGSNEFFSEDKLRRPVAVGAQTPALTSAMKSSGVTTNPPHFLSNAAIGFAAIVSPSDPLAAFSTATFVLIETSMSRYSVNLPFPIGPWGMSRPDRLDHADLLREHFTRSDPIRRGGGDRGASALQRSQRFRRCLTGE